MSNNRGFILTAGAIFALTYVLIFSLPSDAAGEDSVAATVTVQNISVSVTDGTVAYGTLGLAVTADTNPADLQTATNDGNITEKFNIKGTDSADWVLASSGGAEDEYVHKFCIATCGTPPTNYTALTTSYATLNASVATSGTQTFDLAITTPTTSTVYTQQNVDVTVQATTP